MNKVCNIYFNRCDTLLEEFNNTEHDEYDNLFITFFLFYHF